MNHGIEKMNYGIFCNFDVDIFYSHLNESRNDELNVHYYLKYMEILTVLCFEIFGLVG